MGIIGSPIIAGVSSTKLDSTAIAPAYSASSTYAVGAHATNNGALYECIIAITNAEAWDPSKWRMVSVIDETVHAVSTGNSVGTIAVSTEQGEEDVEVNGLCPVDPIMSGEIVSFDDGADDIPVKSLVVDIEPVQEGSGDPSPDNVRPITGWTGAKVTRAGKNLISVTRDSTTISGVTITHNGDGTYTLNGTATGNVYFNISGLGLPENTYTLSGCAAGGGFDKYYIYTYPGYYSDFGSGGGETFTGPVETCTIYVANGTQVSNLVFKPQIELGSTATAYEPYQGNSYAIGWTDEAGTVYGGTLDVTTGVLTVDREGETFDGNSSVEIWTNNQFRFALKDYGARSEYNICNMYTHFFGGWDDMPNNCFQIIGSLRVRDTRFNTVQEFLNFLSENPLQVVYYRSTPLTYQLTPTEVTTLLGVNNIYADTGNVEVAYRSDDLKFAPVDSPAFTGIPIVPTAEAGTNNSQAASTAFVQEAVESSASETLEAAKDYTDEVFGEHSIVRSVTTGDIDGSVSVDTDGAEADVLVKGLGPVIKTATGEFVSIDDGAEDIPVKSLTVGIEPVQDLNGYDAPWPPGGGKNLLDYDAWKGVGADNGTAVFENNGVSLTATADNCYTWYTPAVFPSGARVPVTEGEVLTLSWESDQNISGSIWIFGNGETTSLATINNLTAQSLTYTVPAGVSFVTFRFGVATVGNTISYKNIQIEFGDTATAYAPYSNICPISGWTGAQVTRTGKNSIDYSNIELSGRAIEISQEVDLTGTYIFSYDYSLSEVPYPNSAMWKFKVDGTTKYLAQGVSPYVLSGHITEVILLNWAQATGIIHWAQLEEGNVATAYEPYQGETYNISFPAEAGTVYGGTLDVTSGVLTVDRAMVDAGQLAWGYRDDGSDLAPYFYGDVATLGVKYEGVFTATIYNLLCTQYKTTTRSVAYFGDNCITVDGAVNIEKVYQFQVKDARYVDVNSFQAAMSGVQLVYRLATPVTYQLTPQEVTTLLGVNNIWADTGDIDITYRTNISKYAPIDSPAFTGEPLTPTPDEDSDNNQVASTAFVKKAINANSVTSVDTGTVDGTVSVVKDGVASDVVVKGLEDTVKVESGEFVSVDDGADDIPVKSLVVDVEPVQDLNGYDAPWPPGGGKNLFYLPSQTFDGGAVVIDDGVVAVTKTPTSNYAIKLAPFTVPQTDQYILNGSIGGSASTYQLRIYDSAGTTVLARSLDGDSSAVSLESGTEYGLWVFVFANTVLSNKQFYPMLRLASETDSSFAPYSNICPITGWTGAKVTRTGKNLLDVSKAETITTPNNQQRNGLYVKVNRYETYTISIKPGIAVYVLWINQNGDWASSALVTDNLTATFQPYASEICVHAGGGYNLANATDLQLEYGSTATEYESYRGNSYAIDWTDEAGTVYGGTLDVTTGLLTVDRAGFVLTDGTNITEGINGNAEWLNVRHSRPYPYEFTAVGRDANICSHAPFKFANVTGNIHFYTVDYATNFFFPKTIYPDVNSFISTLTSVPLTYVGFLAKPRTYQLTPQEVSTLLGVNNIWADTGEIEVAYRTGLPGFAPTDSPVLTGTPLSPTAPERSDNSQVANTNFVQSAVYDSVAGIYTFGGRDLSTVFGSAENLHAAIEAGDFRKIHIGDYWPITLSGNFVDAATGTTKTLSNAVFKVEVAAINPYYRFGDTALNSNHVVFVSRDLMPIALQMRSESSTWYDTTAVNPWLGSALYATLNNATNGVIKLVEGTDIGAYIYSGPNGKGMRYMAESMAAGASAPTTWAWSDRGKLFLLSEREVYGSPAWQASSFAGGILYNQYPIFRGSGTHIIKGLGNGGSRCTWWLADASTDTTFCFVANYGIASTGSATYSNQSVPLCFLMV